MGTERSPLSERTASVVRCEGGEPEQKENEMMKRIAIVLLCIVTAGFALVMTIEGERTRCPDITVTVAPGDSAWLIAETHCEGNIENATARIVDEHGANLTVGMKIDLP